MEHDVGLDVSLKLTAICIVDRTGKIQREGVVHSDPEAIAAFIKSNASHVARIGLETGATSTWLWTELNAIMSARADFGRRVRLDRMSGWCPMDFTAARITKKVT
jgi:hypothetical protein